MEGSLPQTKAPSFTTATNIILFILLIGLIGGAAVSCYFIVAPMNNATNPNRHHTANFTVIGHDTFEASGRSTVYSGTLNMRMVSNPDYQCWLTTDIEDMDKVTALNSCIQAYPTGTWWIVWYNPNGNSCGFSENAAVSGGAVGMIILFIFVTAGMVWGVFNWRVYERDRQILEWETQRASRATQIEGQTQ